MAEAEDLKELPRPPQEIDAQHPQGSEGGVPTEAFPSAGWI